MTFQTTSRSPDVPLPSFSSVFGVETIEKGGLSHDQDALGAVDQTQERPTPITSAVSSASSTISPYSVFHQQRDSTSTSNSESSDSSPTTTASTMDTSSVTEPSPGTTPESPVYNTSPNSVDGLKAQPSDSARSDEAGVFFENRHVTPAKKARNLKNLAVNTQSAFTLGRGLSTGSLPIIENSTSTERVSAPASPSFVKPPTPPKRKLSNLGLTIQTPGNAGALPAKLTIPATPSLRRPNALRHFQSSPSLPLCTPSFAPEGGMQLPSLRPRRPTPPGFAQILPEAEEDEQEPNFDVPQSREEKPDSYPNGPICIYESGVDLYLEPSAEVAALYDVVMNVASEVKNPFKSSSAPASAVEPPTLGLNVGILVREDSDSSSPTTPKATPLAASPPTVSHPQTSLKQPEYIHIPWEHNTDIVPDLLRLVSLIDDRVQQGKRVLVHCQCGVSRSASLIVAYGLYKNPGISVQDAYDAVKRRSKWIGPNMNLIMQLQEFRSSLVRGRQNQAYGFSRRLSPAISSAISGNGAFLHTPSTPNTPKTGPLSPDVASPQRASTGDMQPVSAGALPSPGATFWDSSFRRSWDSSQQAPYDISPPLSGNLTTQIPYVDPKGLVIPVVAVHPSQPSTQESLSGQLESAAISKHTQRQNVPNFSRRLAFRQEQENAEPTHEPLLDSMQLTSPRSTEFGMSSVSHAPADDAFGILSPVRTEFPSSSPSHETPFEQSLQSDKALNKGNRFREPSPPSLSGLHPTQHPAASFEQWREARKASLTDSETTSHSLASSPEPPSPEPTLSTPVRGLKAKFSSPNIHEQLKLQKLQHDIEAQSPSRSLAQGPEVHDSLDTLASPRATEFTNNPFHSIISLPKETSVKQDQMDRTESEAQPTPGKIGLDPRSPAQTGISPITRNIWDVL
ncbi:hypothetical protein LTS18_005620 [Coniosporium uncinatum]|uniref:Uncharacterized protein n=1 Tax=Coniosporium uncinatum TaxID=93489 RepID=A0ACC3DB92_9PEZI|nr:hypothetical protein LTS18_005620 [Coniosporium uncinatum]